MALTKVSGDILDTGIVVAGVTTSTNFKTGTSNLHSSGIEIAGINVLGADTPIGAGVTIYNSGGADFTGVVTATRFVGQADISGGSITATTGTFSGDVSIGGTLTYQDVTNVDSTGIATARVGLDILSGGLNIVGLTTGLHVSGIITATNAIVISEDNAIHFKGTAADDLDAILRASAGGGQLLINSRNDTILNIDSNADSTDAHFAVAHGAATGSSTELFRVQENGKVGIGTDDPDKKLEVWDATQGVIRIRGGGGGSNSSRKADLSLFASGAREYVIRADASDAAFKIIDVSGSNAERLHITSAGHLGVGDDNPDTRLSVKAASGTDVVGKFTSTDANAWIQFRDNSTTDTGVMVGASGDNLLLRAGSNTRVTIDSSGHILPGAAGTQNLGSTTKEFNNLYLGDSGKAYFGLDQDLSIYFDHSTGNSQIHNTTGTLRIRGDSIKLNNAAANKNAIVCESNIVTLFYDNAARLATNANGISVTGEVAATQDYPDFRPTLDFNFAAVKKLDSRITYYRTGPSSYVDEFGIVKLVGDNIPRFDHDPVTRECKGLLIEESRINVLPYSTDVVGNSNWQRAGVLTENTTAVKAPDGSYDAIALRDDGSNGQHTLYDDVAISDITDVYTSSCWIKAGSKSYGEIFCNGTGSSGTITIAYKFNLSTGAATYTGSGGFQSGTSTTVTEYPNGWWRCSVTCDVADSASGSGTFRWHVRPRDDSSGNYQGNNSIGIYVWGLQLEKGTFPTSYIPGSSTGGTATRGYEYLSMEGSDASDLYNALEGTLVAEWIATESEANQNLVSFHKDLGQVERIELRATASNTAKVRFEVVTGSSSTVSDSSISHGGIGDNTKAAFGFKKDDYAFSVNGSAVATDSSGNMPSDINSLMIGRAAWGTSWFDGYVKRILYYPKRLPNSQLITITS